MWAEPESNADIDEAIGWYQQTLKWRLGDQQLNYMSPSMLMDLYQIEPCGLDFQYLKDVVFEIDRTYIQWRLETVRQQAEKQNKAAS